MRSIKFLLLGGAILSATAARARNPTDTTSHPDHGETPYSDPSTNGSSIAIRGTIADVTARNGAEKSLDSKIHALAEERKGDAHHLAGIAKHAEVPPEYAAKLREALDGDMQLWREEYHPSGADWKIMHKQWLVDAKSLTAGQWAQQRADWYDARDAWIAVHR